MPFYADIAAVYDNADHDQIPDSMFRFIEDRYTAPGMQVVDVGCGTGRLAIALALRGYDVVGLDASGEMLRIARQHAREAGMPVTFRRCDITRSFATRPRDLVVSSGDIVNHFPHVGTIRRFFRSASRMLRPGGLFVFDSLSLSAFRQFWVDTTYHWETESGDLIFDCEWDEGRRVGTAHTIVFRKLAGGRYRKRASTLQEYHHPRNLLREELRRTGFTRIGTTAWDPWSEPDRPDYRPHRTLWTARRPR